MVVLSVLEKSEVWDRWESGESERSIGRAVGRSSSTIHTVLVSSGWRRPLAGCGVVDVAVVFG